MKGLDTRILEEEILDSMPPDDPEAIRSRRDLRMINAMMLNHRWMISQIRKFIHLSGDILELGAGDGDFLESLTHFAAKGTWAPDSLTGIDLAPRPTNLSPSISWQQENVLNLTQEDFADKLVITTLFLHHLDASQLNQLGSKLASARAVLAIEPLRNWVALAEAYAIFPLVNRVTRNDMIISIKAGFRHNQLPELLGLSSNPNWTTHVSCSMLGGYRFAAIRK